MNINIKNFKQKDFDKIIDFYECFSIPLPVDLKKAKNYLDEGGLMNDEFLDFVKRAMLSAVASRTEDVFADEIFDKVSLEAAEELVKMNKI